jgi:hypothetical protein
MISRTIRPHFHNQSLGPLTFMMEEFRRAASEATEVPKGPARKGWRSIRRDFSPDEPQEQK